MTESERRNSLHKRLRTAKGKASDQQCVDCGGPARDWSQIHGTDENDFDNYVPRCRRDHVIYDKPFRHTPEQNQQRRAKLTDRVFSEESRRKMSESAKNRKKKDVHV